MRPLEARLRATRSRSVMRFRLIGCVESFWKYWASMITRLGRPLGSRLASLGLESMSLIIWSDIATMSWLSIPTPCTGPRVAGSIDVVATPEALGTAVVAHATSPRRTARAASGVRNRSRVLVIMLASGCFAAALGPRLEERAQGQLMDGAGRGQALFRLVDCAGRGPRY